MARLAVFASGRGSNFSAIAARLKETGRHTLALLVCDQPGAAVLERARELGVPSALVTYAGKTRRAAEAEMLAHVGHHGIHLVALAGFMRLLSPFFLAGFPGQIVNVHPSLLPKYPGTHGIEESFRSGDKTLGISVIRIDEGCDTGPVLAQKRFVRKGPESLAQIEERIHRLEHELFPRIVLGLLDGVEAGGGAP
jgi:phosphoribosylglycinamide formyltransferase 1